MLLYMFRAGAVNVNICHSHDGIHGGDGFSRFFRHLCLWLASLGCRYALTWRSTTTQRNALVCRGTLAGSNTPWGRAPNCKTVRLSLLVEPVLDIV